MKSPNLHYGSGKTAAGTVLIVWTKRGICDLRLLETRTLDDELAELCYKHGVLPTEDAAAAGTLLNHVDAILSGMANTSDLLLDLQGTPFQQRVWQELLRVPRGETITYQELAARIKQPRAVRAVANACARNPVGLVVPCHRIVRSDGGLGGYFYGVQRKRAILKLEGVAV